MDCYGESSLFVRSVDILSHAETSRTLEEKRKILQGKLDPTRSRVERVMLAPQDKEEVLKLTQQIRFAMEIAMVSLFWSTPVTVTHNRLVRRDHQEQCSDPSARQWG